MKKNKRIFPLLLIFTFLLTACGGSKTEVPEIYNEESFRLCEDAVAAADKYLEDKTDAAGTLKQMKEYMEKLSTVKFASDEAPNHKTYHLLMSLYVECMAENLEKIVNGDTTVTKEKVMLDRDGLAIYLNIPTKAAQTSRAAS